MHIARSFAALVITTGLAVAVSAFAHPQLVVADPAQGATLAKVSQVALTFSEPLAADRKSARLVGAGPTSSDNFRTGRERDRYLADKVGSVRRHPGARFSAISRPGLSVPVEFLAAIAVLGPVDWTGAINSMGISN